VADPSQRVLDRSQEPTVSLMQPDLKICFGIGIGFVDRISYWGPPCRYASSTVRTRRQHLLPLLKQQSLIAIELPRIHDNFIAPAAPFRFCRV
jgi:hypothetical protein